MCFQERVNKNVEIDKMIEYDQCQYEGIEVKKNEECGTFVATLGPTPGGVS